MLEINSGKIRNCTKDQNKVVYMDWVQAKKAGKILLNKGVK